MACFPFYPPKRPGTAFVRFALVIGVQQLFYSGNANIAAECIFVTEAAPSRRDEVARIAVELIVNGGLKAVTFRNLAKQLGCSTTVITLLSSRYAKVCECNIFFQVLCAFGALVLRYSN
jgi:hypothetical protein